MKNGFKIRYGSWALVAGAAQGLGRSFATALAAKGMNVLLVDLNVQALELLEKEIEQKHQVTTFSIAIDLADKKSVQLLLDKISDTGCRLIVYNAAYSRVAPFLAQTADELDRYVDVNCRSLIRLCHGFAQHHEKGSRGGILIMSSLSGLIGSQLVASYSATKAFGALLAESLSHELKDSHIDVMACLAGPTATPGFHASAPQIKGFMPHVHHPDFVAQKALAHLGKRTFYIPGGMNRLSYAFLLRCLPRSIASKWVNKAICRIYSDKL